MSKAFRELGGLPYIRTLFESPFLQEGHMASCSSSFCSGARPFTGVESVDWDPEDRGCHVKSTGIKFFNLQRGIRRGWGIDS